MRTATPSTSATSRHVMGLLGAGVPLTLLLDIAGVPGSFATEILDDEAGRVAW